MKAIMIGSDFSASSSMALKMGHIWSRKLSLPCHMQVISSVAFSEEKFMHYHSGSAPKVVDWEHDNYLSDMIEQQLEDSDIPRDGIQVSVCLGNIEETLLNEAKRKDAMLFLGSKGHSFFDQLLLGSVSEKVAHLSSAPTVIVKNDKDAIPRKILVALDPDIGIESMVDQVKDLAKEFSAEIVFVNILPKVPEHFFRAIENFNYVLQGQIEENKAIIMQDLAPIQSQFEAEGIKSRVVLKEHAKERTSHEILKIAQDEQCDLICLQHSRLRTRRSLLGSTAMEIIRKSKQNILLVS